MSEALINSILQKEGSEYTNRKNDKGGPTKFGITLRTLSDVRGEKLTAADVEALTEDEARNIYRTIYIEKSPFRNVQLPLRDMLIDWAVTSGSDDPTFAIQRLLNDYGAGLTVDGIFGKKTEAALQTFIQQWGEQLVYDKMIDARVLFYCKLVTKDPTQSENCLGWVKRALSFRRN